MKKYTVKKIADLAGITLKTLRHYDKIGLLVPGERGDNNYRLYSEKDLERLQQIMFYKELDFALEQIKDILSGKDYTVESALEKQIILLKQKMRRLENIATLAEKTLKNLKGELTMTEQEKFEAFKGKMIAANDSQYGKEVIQKYGADTYKASKNKLKSMTKEQYQELEQLSLDVNNAFIAAQKTGNPKSAEARKAVELHKKWLMFYWTEFSAEAYRGLANNYVDDERFAAYYNKLGDNMAVFVRDSILKYINQ